MQYDLLVGADGVGSTVRSEMEHQLPGMSGTCHTDSHYQTLTPKWCSAQPLHDPEVALKQRQCVHVLAHLVATLVESTA